MRTENLEKMRVFLLSFGLNVCVNTFLASRDVNWGTTEKIACPVLENIIYFDKKSEASMKLNSKCFLLAALMLLGFTSGTFAAEQVFAYSCAETEDEFGQGGMGPIECNIGQYSSEAAAMAQGYSEGFIFSTWPALVESMNSELGWDMPSNASDLQMFLVTDMDMGGYVVNGSDTTCAEGFVPIDFSTFQKVLSVFDGGNHVIRNFCQIESQDNAGFFKNLYGTLRDLTFDSAYVKAEGNAANALSAGVVASTADGAGFSNVTVMNSVVRATSVAGGIVGSYALSDYARQTGSVYVDAVLRSATVGGVFGEVSYSGNPNLPPQLGIDGAEVNIDAGSLDAGNVTAGGLVGKIDILNADIGFSSNTATIVVSGSAEVVAGGLVGRVSYGNNSETRTFQNMKNTVDLFMNTAGGNVYVGGIAGSVSLEKTVVVDTLNAIHAVIASKTSDEGEMLAGGEFGTILTVSSARIMNENVDVRIVGGKHPVQRLGGVVGDLHGVSSGALAVAGGNIKASIASTGTGMIEVAMGGLVGYATETSDGTYYGIVFADTSNVTVSMEAASSGDVYAGGLAGYINANPSGSDYIGGLRSYSMQIKSPDGTELIKLTSKNVNRFYAGGIAGRIVSPRATNEIRRFTVDGDIVVAAETVADSSAAGGLFGEVIAARTSIYDNLSRGNVLSNIENTGFVIGKNVASMDETYGVKIIGNVHYGTEDANAKMAIGSMCILEVNANTNDSSYTPITDWNQGPSNMGSYNYSVTYNYRNSIETGNALLEPTGDMIIDGSGYIATSGGKLIDGVLDESTMKSRKLAYAMSVKSVYTSKDYELILDSANVCWENGTDSTLYPCEYNYVERTVHKVEISLDGIYPKLSENDKKSLAGQLYATPIMEEDEPTGDSTYSLIAYTEKNGHLSEGFVERARSLSVAYGTVDENGSAYEFESMGTSGDQMFYTRENYDIEIVYEIAEPNVEPVNYVSLDEALPDLIYLWPKVTKVHRYGAKGTVPPVFTMSGNTKQEYYMQFAVAECPDDNPECEIVPISAEISGPMTFSSIIERLLVDGGWPYKDKIHLIYEASSSQEKKTPIMTVGGDANRFVKLYGYGYGKGAEQELFDSTEVGGNGFTTLEIASKYTAKAGVGFELNKWKVDFWVYLGGNGSAIEKCYDESSISEDCSITKSYKSDKNFFARVQDIKEAVYNYDGEAGGYLKWSVDLDSNEQVDMDSIVLALAYFTGGDHTYSYHMHVTPSVKAIPYTIGFNVNAEGIPVFVGGYTDTLTVYSMENEMTMRFPMLYSAMACFEGWGEKATESQYGAWELNEYILGAVTPEKGSFSLFARWMIGSGATGTPDAEDEEGECFNMPTRKLPLQFVDENGAERGSVYLWQAIVNPDDTLELRHDFTDGVLKIPNASDELRFHVGAAPKSGYVLSYAKVAYKDVETQESDTLLVDVLHGNDVFALNSDMELEAFVVKFAEYIPIALDLNSEKEDVFFDDRFDRDSALKVIEGGGQLELPAWIYTADACVLGWSVNGDAEDYEYRIMVDSDELYEKAGESKKLYAVWGGAQECIEKARYIPVKAVASGGKVELLEGDGRDARVHKFGEDGTLILPRELAQNFRVHVVPDNGYDIERILLVQNGESVEVENGEWLDINSADAELRVYFVESGEPVVATGPVFYKSGNAVRFVFGNNGFVKDDGAEIRISLENDDGKVMPDSLFTCYADDCRMAWEKYPLAAGNYLFKAVLFDGRDSTVFERDFEVAAGIAVAGKKSWQMISLARVDMDELKWDGDEKFYWWDEERSYGKYWQYQELNRKHMPDQNLGYWYNSIEGRPLKLKEDAFVDNTAWELKNLNSGWNLVANPYGWCLDLGVEDIDTAAVMEWLEERKDREDVDPEWFEKEKRMMLTPSVEFWRWNAETGNYDPAKILEPYEAVWVKLNDAESETWELSASPAFVNTVDENGNENEFKSLNRSLFKFAGTSSKKLGWSLQVTLSDANGKKDSWNVLGAGVLAAVSEEPPAGMGDHVNLTILDGGKRLAKSVKAAGEGSAYEWTVELSATSDRTGYLDIAGADALLESGLRVFVTVDGNTVEARSGEKLPVALSAVAKTALIRVAPSAKQVVAGSLQGVRAMQSGRMLEVSFDAPANMDGSGARVDVFDTKGTLVASTSLRATEGKNMVSLESPRRGIYAVRVAVAGQVSVQKVLLK